MPTNNKQHATSRRPSHRNLHLTDSLVLFGWLLFNVTLTQTRHFGASWLGRNKTSSGGWGLRSTSYIQLLYSTEHNENHKLTSCNLAIHHPAYLLYYYVRAFTNNKHDFSLPAELDSSTAIKDTQHQRELLNGGWFGCFVWHPAGGQPW